MSCLSLREGNEDMTSDRDIAELYKEFTEALPRFLRKTPLAPLGGAALPGPALPVKKHPKYSEHEYFLAVENAFQKWEVIQNVGR